MVNYGFKAYVLNNHADLLKKAKKSSLLEYAVCELATKGVIMPFWEHFNNDVISINDLHKECAENGLNDVFNECLRINDANSKRTLRLKQRIEGMLLSGSCLFLTLTFSDDTLANTTDKQRRVFVSRYLKTFNCKYVANIDFGATNHREHYHAIISSDKIAFDGWRKYGNINAERIRNRNINCDKTKLAKYICKLSNHAIKETTKRSCLIYSR